MIVQKALKTSLFFQDDAQLVERDYGVVLAGKDDGVDALRNAGAVFIQVLDRNLNNTLLFKN